MTDNSTMPQQEPASSNQGAENQEKVEGTPFEQFVKHQRRALEETGKAIDTLLPPGFKEHSAEAGRQFVQGFKVLVDATIAELEKQSKEFDARRRQQQQQSTGGGDDRPSSTGRTKVKVEVD